MSQGRGSRVGGSGAHSDQRAVLSTFPHTDASSPPLGRGGGDAGSQSPGEAAPEAFYKAFDAGYRAGLEMGAHLACKQIAESLTKEPK